MFVLRTYEASDNYFADQDKQYLYLLPARYPNGEMLTDIN